MYAGCIPRDGVCSATPVLGSLVPGAYVDSEPSSPRLCNMPRWWNGFSQAFRVLARLERPRLTTVSYIPDSLHDAHGLNGSHNVGRLVALANKR
jgi:hypothetical protein